MNAQVAPTVVTALAYPWWPGADGVVAIDMLRWACLAAAAGLAAAMAAWILRATGRRRAASVVAVGALGLGAVGAALDGWVSTQQWAHVDEIGAPLRPAPDPRTPASAVLEAGSVVIVRETRGAYARVQTDSRTGWVDRARLQMDAGSTPPTRRDLSGQ
jgi:hypothetical protein